MDKLELKQEQYKLSRKVVLRDRTQIKTIAGVICKADGTSLIACVVVCDKAMKVLETKIYTLHDPLPFMPGYLAYREMPAIVEVMNMLEIDPDVVMINGPGIAHPRRIGIASHSGIILNQPTIGITQKLPFGNVEKGRIIMDNNIVGFGVKTKEYANAIYVSPGHLVSLGTCLNVVKDTIKFPHKMPEPMHLANKYLRKARKQDHKN